jgi:hypothetical protein
MLVIKYAPSPRFMPVRLGLCALMPLANLHHFSLHSLISGLMPFGWLRSITLTPYF